ncbi:hypothetical protein T01_15808 [Trichinella spiralis]|uniref:Uncharacterized protein n=1 Tax=Trichinella spiralis TaxID=6334 RepID=A0A0V0Z3U3_TRISP|nr:hypothetical protein T01_15808 [Trichinella spiralis]
MHDPLISNENVAKVQKLKISVKRSSFNESYNSL